MDKIKINVEILIPDGEDCTYSKNDGLRDSYECSVSLVEVEEGKDSEY